MKRDGIVWKILPTLNSFIKRELSITSDCGQSYTFSPISRKKLWNWLVTELFAIAKIAWTPGFPTFLQLELTNICNLHCPGCPMGSGAIKRPKGKMDLEDFKKIIDEVGDYLLVIIISDWGEPFLNGNLCEMVAYGKRKEIKFAISTNGHFLDDRVIERLIEIKLDVLTVSLDGATQETYHKYRKGGNIKKVIDCLEQIQEKKKAKGVDLPLINLQFILMKHNEHEIHQIESIAKEFGVDQLTFKTYNPSLYKNQLEKIFVPQKERYRRYSYPKGFYAKQNKRSLCKKLWNTMTIYWDGSVVPCHLDINKKMKLGNVFNSTTLKATWNCAEYRILRKRFKRSWQKISLCSKCTYAFMKPHSFRTHSYLNEVRQ